MIVARGHRSLVAAVVLMASVGLMLLGGLTSLSGCKGVSDSVTYPDPPIVLPPPYFFSVWGTGPDDVYVVGQPGLIYHFDGTAWSRQNSPTTEPLTSVWGDPQTNRIYVTGHHGVILTSTGDGNWAAMISGTGENLYDVGEFYQMKYPNPAQTRMVLAVGHKGTILRLTGDAWQPAADAIMVRDNQNAPADTLSVQKDMIALSAVFQYGVCGAYLDERPVGGGEKGCVLLNDPVLDWQLRPIAGGENWVTSAATNTAVMDNYVGTGAGRLFRMSRLSDGTETFAEMHSPSLGEAVYGLWAPPSGSVTAVSAAGRIGRVAVNNVFTAMYHDGLTLFDVWGSAEDNLYAVGINGRILHYFDAPGEPEGPEWVGENVELPTTKSFDGTGYDKFGRRF